MRRPILLVLFIQVALILILYYINPFGLGALLDRPSLLVSHADSVATVEGTVLRVQIKEYYTALTVNTGKENTLVRLTGDIDEVSLYDLAGRKVALQGTVSIPQGRRNLGCFDYRLYLKGQGIYTIINASKYRFEAGRIVRPLTHFLSYRKGIFFSHIRPYLSDNDFAVLSGLLFGDKSYMDDELYESFQENGIAHILAVSGLHVSLLYSVTEKIIRKRKNVCTAALCLIIICIYTALSGFSVSVLRAALMISLRILSLFLRRRYDSVSAASFAAILFLLFRPYLLFSSGFQLSFMAAYSMGVALPYFKIKLLKYSNRKKNERLYDIGSVCLTAFVIQLGMMPLTAFHFLNFSPVSLLLNPFAIFLAGLILPSGLAVFIISFFLSGIPLGISLGPVNLFLKALGFINDLGQKSGLSFSVPAPPVHVLLLYYIVFFWFFSETRAILNRKNQQKTLAAIAACIMLFMILMPKGYEQPSVYFADVGQGDCILLNIGGKHILIDGGGNYFKNIGKETLKPFLLKNGIRSIDLAIVTHKDMDHSKGVYELSECFDIKKIIDRGNDNDDCIVCGIEADGIKYLFMADATIKREAELIKQYPSLSCDVLKAGHHGSSGSSSDEFLKAVNPSFAVFSCGLNNSYGHPSSKVLQLMKNNSIIYARTDYFGAIYVDEVRTTGNRKEIIFRNAAKDKTWHIVQNNQTGNIPSAQ